MSSELAGAGPRQTPDGDRSGPVEVAREIPVTELHDLRQQGIAHRVLDVREAWELEICALADAIHVPMGQVPDRAGELPRDELVVVLCHHGMRSDRVTNWLRHNGFPLATNLAGGIDAWARVIDPGLGRY